MVGHEPLREHRRVVMGSDRSFGLVFAGIFALIACWPALRHGEAVRWWALGASLVFLGLSIFADERLAPLNRLWFKFGLALHTVIGPVVMGLLFFGAVLPVGLVLRAAGKDLLRLRPSDEISYWIRRDPPGPGPKSMSQQF